MDILIAPPLTLDHRMIFQQVKKVHGQVAAVIEKLNNTARTRPRMRALVGLFATMNRGLTEVGKLLSSRDLPGAVAELSAVAKGLLEGLHVLDVPGSTNKLSSDGARQLGKLLPGLGAALSGYDTVDSLRKATLARDNGNGSAALLWSIKASLDGLSATLSGVEGMALVGGMGAPVVAGLQVSVLVLQVGCVLMSEVAESYGRGGMVQR
jgi:hypothetical protein